MKKMMMVDVDENGSRRLFCVEFIFEEVINYIQITAKKHTSALEYSIMKEFSMGMFKRTKVWSNTRIVVYEFEMLKRFLKKSIYFDVPYRILLLARCNCLTIFAIKVS